MGQTCIGWWKLLFVLPLRNWGIWLVVLKDDLEFQRRDILIVVGLIIELEVNDWLL